MAACLVASIKAIRSSSLWGNGKLRSRASTRRSFSTSINSGSNGCWMRFLKFNCQRTHASSSDSCENRRPFARYCSASSNSSSGVLSSAAESAQANVLRRRQGRSLFPFRPSAPSSLSLHITVQRLRNASRAKGVGPLSETSANASIASCQSAKLVVSAGRSIITHTTSLSACPSPSTPDLQVGGWLRSEKPRWPQPTHQGWQQLRVRAGLGSFQCRSSQRAGPSIFCVQFLIASS